ncbi:MAG: hypothetical protein V3R29_07375 [Candidatus Acidoferrales bacterium]
MTRQKHARHGLHALKKRVLVAGLEAVDGRTVAAKALLAWRRELVADLGGVENLSAQQMALVELAARTKLLVDSVDAWIMQQRSLVNARKRALLPVVRERTQLADSLARYLSQLGLERKAPPPLSLQEYLARKGAGESAEGERASQSEAQRDQGATQG